METGRKFLENDLVKIVKNTYGHNFKIGERVRLNKRVSPRSWSACTLDNDNDWWYIGENEIELAFKRGDRVKVRNYEDLCKEFVPDMDGDFYFDSTRDHEFRNTIETENKMGKTFTVVGVDIDDGIEVEDDIFAPEILEFEFKRDQEREDETPNAPFKITITSDGNTTNCTYEEYGKVKEVKAKLHPDDKFDFKTGVDLCIERAFDFSINEGDIVEVTDEGKMYSTYADWLVTNKIPVEIASRYCYGLDEIPLYKTYKVIKKANRLPDDKLQLLLIQDTNGGKVFLISEDGTRKVED